MAVHNKILTIISSEFPPGPGGIGTHAWQIARILSKLKINVKVLCPLDHVSSEKARQFDYSQKFTTVRWPKSYNSFFNTIFILFFCVKHIIMWKPSLLIGTGSKGILISWAFSLIFRINFMAIGHGAEFTIHKGIKKWIIRMAFNDANKIVCVSNYTKKIATGFGLKSEKIKVIYNGADSDTFKPSSNTALLKNRLGLDNKKIILSVGAVSDRKAQDIVIRALPLILQRVPNVIYVIVGLPIKKKQYLQIAESLNIADKVLFVNSVDAKELPQFYNMCDVFILNSRVASDGENEGFGIVLVEAGLCEKPVIGTKGCGIEEVIIDKETGLLVDSDSPEQTAEAANYLLENVDEAKLIGKNGRKRALSMFTWDMCGKAFYDQILTLMK